jgi:uncharacterized phage protein gp47/JayE
MPLTSNVPRLQFAASGVVVPTESAILTGVLQDMDAAFGGGLNTDNLETPQGQLASSQAAAIGDKNNEILYLSNQVDPQYADGAFQDAIGRIYFLNRKPATSTAVQCILTGVAGTVVPAGTLAQDTSGNTYASTASATIGFLGTVTVEFQNIVTGPIACPAHTLIKVFQAISGWDTIDNNSAGVVGSNVESRADFELRRKNSVAINSTGTPEAIYAAVFDVANVLDCYVIDNFTSATVNTGPTNYPIVAHSVYVAVVGGVDQDIAEAIWSRKDLGCDMNGNTTVTVTDNSGYAYPQPTYQIKFNRPDALPIFFAVEIVDSPSLPGDIEDQVKNAIIAQFNGTNGSARQRIGSPVMASRYYCPILAISDTVQLNSVLVGIADPATDLQVSVGIDETPTIDAANITVTLV